MWIILLTLALGIVLGSVLPLGKKHKEINHKLQHVGVVILLFFMGISIGLNKQLLGQVRVLGLRTLVYGVLTTFLSVVAVAAVSLLFFRSKHKQ